MEFPAQFVRVKSIGNVPVEAFPKGYKVRGKDGVTRNPSEIPLNMVLKVSDQVKDLIIQNMKRRGLKLIVDVEIIDGKAYKVERHAGRIFKTEMSSLPRYSRIEDSPNRLTRRERRSGGNSKKARTQSFPFFRIKEH